MKERQQSLIDKNLKGVINDAILAHQLELIENQLFKAHTIAYQKPIPVLQFDKLYHFAKKYLTKPSQVWSQATFLQKLKLQKFHFPKGVTFDGKNFRTTQTPSLFKTNHFFLPDLSPKADLRVAHTNGVKTTNFNNNEDNLYWHNITTDIISLGEIVQEDEKQPPVLPAEQNRFQSGVPPDS